MVNRRLERICAQLQPAVTEAAIGSPSEIDARLAKAQQSGLIKLSPISQYLGMNVEGVDLKNPLSTEQVATVYAALIRHKVLVFKQININHEQQVRFSYELSKVSPNVGPPTIGHTVFGHVDKFPEVFSVYQGKRSMPKNMTRYKAVAAPNPWTGYHCDITACVNPPSIGMLRGDIIPDGVGDTNFGNLAAAFETLDDATKQTVIGLSAEHEYKFGKTTATEYGKSIATRKMVSHHPLVTVHPDTGEKILFNSPGFLKFIVGQENDPTLLHKIWEHSVKYTIQHQWSQGDLVVWDERSTTHRAPTDVYESGLERQLYRTTLLGQPFQGLDGSASAIVQGEPMLSCEDELASMMHANRTGSSITGNGFGGSAFPEPSQ